MELEAGCPVNSKKVLNLKQQQDFGVWTCNKSMFMVHVSVYVDDSEGLL